MIVKKKHWYRGGPPELPKKPFLPEKMNETINNLDVFFKGNWRTRLGNIPLPDGVKLEDVCVTYEHHNYGDGDACEIRIVFATCEVTDRCENTQWVRDNYKRQLKEYADALAVRPTDVAEWREWSKQMNEIQAQEEIEEAQAVLRKHGKL